MKRKTNLFYLSGDDSNFITFSNYTESLTGNFIATDWKMFPSKFLCLNMKYFSDAEDSDDYNERKSNFIKYVARYYENKMAFLRDYCLDNDLNLEKKLHPLNYLLEAIYRFNDGTTMYDYDSIPTNNDNVQITFVGDITEQDYNGIYADAIHIISASDVSKGDIKFVSSSSSGTITGGVEYTDSTDYLYGWIENSVFTGPSDYKDVKPMFDYDNYYNINSNITAILTSEHTDETNISFNILIPLFDLVDINSDTNTVNLVEDETITDDDGNTVKGMDLTTGTNYIKNVPTGIWFSSDMVELKRDTTTGYAPSWSLVLSSQFKPFPYSHKMPDEITQDATKEAYATYSQILIRQNRLMDKFEETSSKIADLQTQFDNLQGKLNIVSTPYTLDTMHTELIAFEKNIEDKFEAFKQEIYAYIANNWKGYIS